MASVFFLPALYERGAEGNRKEKSGKGKEGKRSRQEKKGAKKAAAKTLKEELAEKVFEVDEVIAEKGEVEKPVKVVKSRRKADGQ